MSHSFTSLLWKCSAHFEDRDDLPIKLLVNLLEVIGPHNADVNASAERDSVAEPFGQFGKIHARFDLHRLEAVHAGVNEAGNQRLDKAA